MAALQLNLPFVDGRPTSLFSSPSSAHPSTAPLSRSIALSPAPRFSARFRRRLTRAAPVAVGKEETMELKASEGEGQEQEASPEDLEYIAQIKSVLERLKKNRDMLFGEVKLTVMIEDPRELERRRLLGIDLDEVTREDMVATLVDVNEGRVPENRLALRLLAEEMTQWPNLEAEVLKKGPRKSRYAKATDTGIDPKEAARRLNIDWDVAADMDSEEEVDEEPPVPPVVGYGALYLVTALPVIIGVSVVLILFYNSLQ